MVVLLVHARKEENVAEARAAENARADGAALPPDTADLLHIARVLIAAIAGALNSRGHLVAGEARPKGRKVKLKNVRNKAADL